MAGINVAAIGIENLRVLLVTSLWPSVENPHHGAFIYRQVKFARQAGVQVDIFKYAGGFSPLAYSRAIMDFHRQLKQKKYDVIHGRFGQSALIICSQRQTPTVITYGGTDVYGRKDENGQLSWFGRLQLFVSRLGFKCADEIILVAEDMTENVPRPDVHIFPDGLDLEIFREVPDARRQLGWSPDKKVVLFVANPQKPIKRFGLAEQAVARARNQLPEQTIELLVVQGEPPERIPFYMSAADALVLTSMHEGSPNVVKEALACNLPVVGVDVGDVRQRIGAIAGCVLCADDRPETIAAGLVTVLQRGERIAGRETVLDLDEQITAKKTIAVYRQAIDRRRRPVADGHLWTP
jgi:glycosyltransferase involved in cell wall biosynthesis